MYPRFQSTIDKELGIIRVKGICFPSYATDEEIKAVLRDISTRSVVPSDVMTFDALVRCFKIPNDARLRRRVQEMPVGNEGVFSYGSGKACIMRYTRLTYIGRVFK